VLTDDLTLRRMQNVQTVIERTFWRCCRKFFFLFSWSGRLMRSRLLGARDAEFVLRKHGNMRLIRWGHLGIPQGRSHSGWVSSSNRTSWIVSSNKGKSSGLLHSKTSQLV
jgi:hypothetical protein